MQQSAQIKVGLGVSFPFFCFFFPSTQSSPNEFVDLRGLILKPGCNGNKELPCYHVMNGMAVQSTVDRGASLLFFIILHLSNRMYKYFLRLISPLFVCKVNIFLSS